jgi:16S rRNA (guanine527-N7)-methyltransferase
MSVQPLSPDLEASLVSLRDRVLDENTRINLTALREPEKCWIGNVLDSLPLLEILEKIGSPKTLIDVGTGGGFPLLPLALAMPEARLTGLDSTAKKIEAIRRIAKDQGIGNVTLVAARAEDAARDPAHREKHDVATARAVADLSVLLEYVSPFVRVGGHIVLWKSLQAEEEIAQSVTAQRSLHAHFEFAHRYALPGDFGERQLLVFRKGAATPKGYPRPVGVPGKTPLGAPKA